EQPAGLIGEIATGLRRIASVVLLQARERVMRDTASLLRRRTDFNVAYPSWLLQSCVDDGLVPGILRLRCHVPCARLHNQIGLTELLAELPRVAARPLHGRRHVFHIACRRTRVDPAKARLDLCVGKGRVVFEVLDADGLVEVPWRHLPRSDTSPD